ncbi:MAG TPA: DUF2312 domain-containing protein [Alphaproteobacteria bacterium]|nr:DUF2312 domain-containing protein [Alphaproteobacteria bacterium]
MVNFGGQSGEQLRALVSKIENLEKEKTEVAEYIRDAYAQAKSQGFDVKILRKVIQLRKKDAEKLQEEEEILDLYKHALGMIPSSSKENEKEAA